MRFRAGLILCCCAAIAWSQTEMNIAQIADFIRSELALKQHSDKQIAAYVKKLQLSEKLTDKTIIDLQSQGAGPKTVEALKALRDQTATMKPPSQDATYSPATAQEPAPAIGSPTVMLSAKAPPIPPPDSVTQRKILDQMKEYALNYTQNLPNFVCVQVIRKAVDPNAGDSYRSLGTVLAKVSYNEGQEHYNVYSVNGKLTDSTMDKVRGGGAMSTGEFGSLMREIFEAKSDAEFAWDHWGTLRGRRMAVFNYSIDSGHSSFSISYGAGEGDEQRIITAYNGLIYADPATGEITRIKFVAVNIPKTFPVRATTEILDYDLVEISGQNYVVPKMAQLLMLAGRESAKNEIEFRNYRKYGTDSSITYDADPNSLPPLPPAESQEQPADASKPAAPPPAKKPASTGDPFSLPTAPPPPPK
ncbi:MAG TPA: hypothetical protein VK604_19285 [Bryobacteraceae bacterium]|nr:hypothetical protein [Bryobacteraceae bacterium]